MSDFHRHVPMLPLGVGKHGAQSLEWWCAVNGTLQSPQRVVIHVQHIIVTRIGMRQRGVRVHDEGMLECNMWVVDMRKVLNQQLCLAGHHLDRHKLFWFLEQAETLVPCCLCQENRSRTRE